MKNTLISILNKKPNDYSKFETKFFLQTKKSLVFDKSNKKTSSKVSIIIPCYKSKMMIKKVLLAINAQKNISKEQIEIILINDYPDDNLENIIPKTKFITTIVSNRKNFGAAISRNIGLALAKNKFVCFLDSDTIIAPNYISQHLQRAEILPNIVSFSFRKKVSLNSPTISDKKIKTKTIQITHLKILIASFLFSISSLSIISPSFLRTQGILI